MVVALVVLCEIICRTIFWQPSPIYDILKFIEWNIPIFGTITIVLGWLGISFHFIHKAMRQVDVVAEAAKQLSKPTERPIELPTSLEDIAVQLNTAREQALHDERAVKDAEQRKNDLIVYLAHDLKTPLTSVIGYLTLLRDEPQLSQEMRARYTGIVLEKAERLEDLINEFFDITRFNLSHIELERESVDVTRMLEQVVSEFEPIFAESGLACHLDLPPKMPYLCDPDKMARVFDNLLRNAAYYSLPDTTVEIIGSYDENEMVLSFSNLGKIFPKKNSTAFLNSSTVWTVPVGVKQAGRDWGLLLQRKLLKATVAQSMLLVRKIALPLPCALSLPHKKILRNFMVFPKNSLPSSKNLKHAHLIP